MIKPGMNVWRLAVSRAVQSPPPEDKLWTNGGAGTAQATACLSKMGQTMANLLQQAQPSVDSFVHYGKARTAWAWAIGNARPVEAIEARWGNEAAAVGMPVGETLATRCFSPIHACPVTVLHEDEGQIWWVYVQFWWRQKQVRMDKWPIAVGDLLHGFQTVATLDVAVYPRAQMESVDKLPPDILREKIDTEIAQTIEDIGKLPRETAGWWGPIGIGLGLLGGAFVLSKIRGK
ncbi:MAG: hypothetical protein P8Y27_04995 [Chromatiaceae bacterium]